eukprot:TRINITY_DN580_c0_g1_i1.p1 TRINITY_DN580_c0_g1~~TRINITY_DN580_c0_g1_i1.p1  ORF type:complete len:141 (+),score=7.28 TRINITY_DN580_c0_g1_i1:40-462(+)
MCIRDSINAEYGASKMIPRRPGKNDEGEEKLLDHTTDITVKPTCTALQRTWQAWVRTALTYIGVGVLIAKLELISDHSQLGGITFVLCGLLLLLYSTWRYYYVDYLLQRGHFRKNQIGVILVTILLLSAAIITILSIASI